MLRSLKDRLPPFPGGKEIADASAIKNIAIDRAVASKRKRWKEVRVCAVNVLRVSRPLLPSAL
jgi:hypothetical protein